jgi:hypothetical protein
MEVRMVVHHRLDLIEDKLGIPRPKGAPPPPPLG